MQSGFDYYENRFSESLGLTVMAFRAARLFSPGKIGYLNPDATAIDNLRSFPFLHDEELTKLKEEFPNYLAIASNLQKLNHWHGGSTMRMSYHTGLQLFASTAILSKCRTKIFHCCPAHLEVSKSYVSRTILNPP